VARDQLIAFRRIPKPDEFRTENRSRNGPVETRGWLGRFPLVFGSWAHWMMPRRIPSAIAWHRLSAPRITSAV
jgi:hypothetical protein